MSKKTKAWLVTATSLILAGSVIFASVMCVFGWDFKKLSTVKYETNKHEISETYKNISIKTDTADIVFIPSDDLKHSVVCYEEENSNHSVYVENSTLVIEKNNSKKWFEYIKVSFDAPKITLYIPEGEYGDLSIKSSTSDIEIPKDFKFENLDVAQSTGDVTVNSSVAGALKIKVSTGNISVKNISVGSADFSASTGDVNVSGITSDGKLEFVTSTGDLNLSKINCTSDIELKVSTGEAKISNTNCKNLTSKGSTGNITFKKVIVSKKLSINRSTGDIKFDLSDADEIFIKTDTGDVTGSLLSDKVYIITTDTGDVDVPKTTSGGRCEITTDTGNVELKVK